MLLYLQAIFWIIISEHDTTLRDISNMRFQVYLLCCGWAAHGFDTVPESQCVPGEKHPFDRD